jgi:hypothetical protein
MTVQLNTFSDISTLVNPILERSLAVARDNNVLAGLVTPFSAEGSEDRKFFQYSAVTMNQVGETDDLTSQAFTPAVLGTITPAEWGAQVFLTDQRIASDWNAAREDSAQELGASMGNSVDTNLCGLFNSFTGGSAGASGSLATWAYFFEMQSKLRAAYAPMPYSFVCTPAQWYSLGKAVAPGATVTNSPNIQNEAARNFYVGSVGGVEIYVSANCETSSTDAYAGMFSRAAIGLDIRRPFRIEPDRDASRRGIELNASMVYGYGLYRPTFGVYGILKNAYS